MGKKLKRHVSVVTKFVVVLMLLSTLLPLQIFAHKAGYNEEKNAKEIVDEKLLDAFKEEEYVRYLIILKEQVDTNQVAQQAITQAKKNGLSSQNTKKQLQRAVVSSLQNKAETTQKNLLSYLKISEQEIKTFKPFFIVNSVSVTGTKQSVEDIARFPEVKSILLDEKKQLPITDSKSLSSEEIEWNIEQIGVPELWEDGITGEGVVVANIDSGVEGNHPALKRQYRGYNPEDPENPLHEFNWHDAVFDRKSPMDSDGHGTHTMGTMVGQEENGENKVGVAPGAKWIATRAFFDNEGYDSYILEAAEWVLAPTDENGVPHPEKAPDVVNNSWGGNPIHNDWFLPMVEAWRSAGIIPVFSVGNAGFFLKPDPGSASAPGNYKEVIAVGATDSDGNLADFSLRGPSENGDIKPDLVAPGVSVRSSVPGASWNDFSYRSFNGTSMAAPHVAGTILLMKQLDSSLTFEEVDDILKVTAQNKTDNAYPDYPNNGYGYGFLQANKAVRAVQQGIGTIKGQVVASGIDEEKPTYEHLARKAVFKGRDELFQIRAQDDVSVNTVNLHVSINGETKVYKGKQILGNHLDGIYESVIPADHLTAESFEYWWEIDDFSSKKTKTDVYQVQIKEGVKRGYFEDFEGYPDGWYSFGINNSWEWGKPTYGPKQAASGENVIGTHLRGQYERNSDMTLVMPPILVEEHTMLRFKTWYKLSLFGQDTGTVFISTDGEAWEPLYQVRQENTRWHEVGLDLSDYANEKVYIAFNLKTSDSQNDGWYIDDVAVVNSQSKANVSKQQIFDTDVTLKIPAKAEEVFQASVDFNPVDNADMIPIEATINIEETGWQIKTNPKNGRFSIHHPPGKYTLKVKAYGYEPFTQQVTLDENGIVSPTISLTALPTQTISGEIKSTTGEPIEGARIMLLEDKEQKHAQSEGDGIYELDAYEGTYTLKVYAPGFVGTSQAITVERGQNLMIDLELEPFRSTEQTEIKYDNGRYSKNYAFGKKGNGFAVKMSLDDGKERALLTGAKLQFWASHIPVPGGDDIEIAIYDATGKDGSPGNKLAGPIKAKAKRDLNEWTEVDLSHLGIIVEGDFYIVYLQADDYPYIPGFVSDGDVRQNEGRSWDYIAGYWFKADESAGNYMIRALVDYGASSEVVEPVITSPESGLITNEKMITVRGTAESGSMIQLMHNELEIAVEEVGPNGEFAIPVELAEGKNELQAISLIDGKQIAESEIVTVTLDTNKPVVTIISPQDGETIGEKTVTVKGHAKDQHLDRVTINGQETMVDEQGYFTQDIEFEFGEQQIEVIAFDKAGNETKKQITVYIEEDQEEAFVIENIMPKEDVYLDTGKSVKISFDSEPGLRASFVIYLDEGPVEVPMMEMKSGNYVGFWTARKNAHAEGAIIEVRAKNRVNDKVRKQADGKLFINVGN